MKVSARLWTILLIAASFFAGFVALRPIWDVDIFWHIVAGRWIIDTLSFPSTDIFTFITPPRAWVTFQWLYEVLMAGVDSAGGLAAVRVVNALLHGAAFAAFALFASAALAKRSSGILPAALAVALLFALYADRVRVRPHVFNLLGWSLLLHTFFYSSRGLRARLITAAVIMAVWANMHAGGAFVFLMALLALPAGAVVAKHLGEGSRWQARFTVKEALGIWGLLAAVCALSPNFLQGVWQAWAMLGGSEMLIEEWLPFWHYFSAGTHPLHLLCGLLPLAALAMVIWTTLRRGENRLDVVLFCVGACLLPFRSLRFVYHEAFVLVLVWSGLGGIRAASSLPLRLWPAGQGILTVSLILAALHLHGPAQYGTVGRWLQSYSEDLDQRRFPSELVAPVLKVVESSVERQPMSVFCLPNWGGYLLYHLYPKIRVIADGRGNFSEKLGRQLHFIYLYRHAYEHAAMIQRIYSESGADMVVMQRPAFPRQYVPVQWLPVERSPKGEIWLRWR
jgi:hypothetical protein